MTSSPSLVTANRTVPESTSAADTSHASAVEVTVSDARAAGRAGRRRVVGDAGGDERQDERGQGSSDDGGAAGHGSPRRSGAGGGQAAEARTAGWTAGAVGRAGAEPQVVRMKKYIVGTR